MFICGECNTVITKEADVQVHMRIYHTQERSPEGRIRYLEAELKAEKEQHKHHVDTLEDTLKQINDCEQRIKDLEDMRKSQDIEIERLRNELDENTLKKEILLLKNMVEEKDKAIIKLDDKHSEEVRQLKKQQMQTTENLRSTVLEREVLRENDRILLNTFDMMKQYIEQMKDQYSRNSAVDVVKCEKCGYTAQSPTEIAEHMKIKHTEKYFSCGRCEFKTETEKSLAEHIKWIHETPTLVKCSRCPFESESSDDLKEHEKREHVQETLYECDKCQFDSMIRVNFEAHMNKHKLKTENLNKSCIKWNQGYCPYGTQCNFSHEEIPACRYQESCKNDRCPFYHFNTSWNTFLGRVPTRGRQQKNL